MASRSGVPPGVSSTSPASPTAPGEAIDTALKHASPGRINPVLALVPEATYPCSHDAHWNVGSMVTACSSAKHVQLVPVTASHTSPRPPHGHSMHRSDPGGEDGSLK